MRIASFLGVAILESLVLLPALMLACPFAEARAFKVPPQEKAVFKDDLKKCNERVRSSVTRALKSPRWGSFHFDCPWGTVDSLRAAQSSAIFSNWPDFVKENAEMFGIDPATVRAGRQDGPIRTVYQSFHEAVIVPPFTVQEHSFRVEGTDLIIRTDFVQTKGWSFRISLSSNAAISLVESEWAKNYPRARVEKADLKVLTDSPVCNQCDFPLPAPVWVLKSDSKSNCYINAETGKLCEPCSAVVLGCSF